jgi:hypothetical protein
MVDFAVSVWLLRPSDCGMDAGACGYLRASQKADNSWGTVEKIGSRGAGDSESEIRILLVAGGARIFGGSRIGSALIVGLISSRDSERERSLKTKGIATKDNPNEQNAAASARKTR